MPREADIIRYNIEQMDASFSIWPPLKEELDYHLVRPTLVKSPIIILLSFLLFLLFGMYERAVMSSSFGIN